MRKERLLRFLSRLADLGRCRLRLLLRMILAMIGHQVQLQLPDAQQDLQVDQPQVRRLGQRLENDLRSKAQLRLFLLFFHLHHGPCVF